MAERFLGVTDIFALSEMALRGNKAMADLRIADVQEEDVPGLAADLTAANFGRIKSGASDADLAAALFNMIYEIHPLMFNHQHEINYMCEVILGIAKSQRTAQLIRLFAIRHDLSMKFKKCTCAQYHPTGNNGGEE